MEKEIKSYFLSINDDACVTKGKYASKTDNFLDEIKLWQKDKFVNGKSIRPLQFTFEITNRCNCNCKDCGMSANSIKAGKTKLELNELYSIVDYLFNCGIPSYAITGCEPFLEFNNMCKMLEYSNGKVDVIKIISNGFWGKDAQTYFQKLNECGLKNNKFFVPSIQISIGEQNVDLEYICNIINYYVNNYSNNELHLGIINTRQPNEEFSKLEKLYEVYINKYGVFPKDRIYLTDSYYVNANINAKEKLNTLKYSIEDAIEMCDNRFDCSVGKFISPKIFMKCNGDCYPCEVFNLHKDVFIGNLFKDNLQKIITNLNKNKYVKFIKKFGTKFFQEIIPKDVLKNNYCETSCYACEFCIKYCEKNKLLR